MDNKELLNEYRKQIESNEKLETTFRNECDFNFRDDLNVKEDILICGEESNYQIYPFGKDSMGGVFCLLDDEYVGYISSEGGCGIIAKNVKEFFNLMAVCKTLSYYFNKGTFDNLLIFAQKYEEIVQDLTEEESLPLYEEFIKQNNFETEISKIYKMFKEALITEPAFILQANPEEYMPWDDVFYTNQEYIKKLREENK
ncbi:MAG: hypothetical protein IJB10_00735 [Clostridia bacterium]|nr:hypothetical protein [Clostridia bacterium]